MMLCFLGLYSEIILLIYELNFALFIILNTVVFDASIVILEISKIFMINYLSNQTYSIRFAHFLHFIKGFTTIFP